MTNHSQVPVPLTTRASTPQVKFRTHRPGDIGYIIYRHGALYADQHGYDIGFEAYVAKIMARFIEKYDPERETCLIAERNGQFIGCVTVCKDETMEMTARLRVLLVEPEARGLGLGKQLVQRCVDFSRAKGYKRLVLSTQSDLIPARNLYKAAGFTMLREENNGSFAPPESKSELWETTL